MIRKSIEQICKDYTKIENYDKAVNDTTQIWECHHRLETHFSDGSPRPTNAFLRINELVALGTYYNRPPEELIFLTISDHQKLHGRDEIRAKKLSVANTGKPGTRKGMRCSDEHKAKTSKTLTGHNVSDETRKKISERNRGKVAWNKGLKTGKHFYTNGIETITAEVCPDGFWPGRTFKNKPTGRPRN